MYTEVSQPCFSSRPGHLRLSGLFAKDGVTLADIGSINRNMEPPDGGTYIPWLIPVKWLPSISGIMTELLWSDPQLVPGRSPSKRGVACSFGPDVTQAFLKENDLDYVIRSHEMKEEGYDIAHNGKLVSTCVLVMLYCHFSSADYGIQCPQLLRPDEEPGGFYKVRIDTVHILNLVAFLILVCLPE